MAWTTNNAAHKRTYIGLFVLEQNKADFDVSNSIRMDQLRFWTPGSSTNLIQQQARMIAIQMHNIFIELCGATLEPGVTAKKAVNAMAKSLSTKASTIEMLADVNDQNYVFI